VLGSVTMTKLTKLLLAVAGFLFLGLAFAAVANADSLSDLEAANPQVTNPNLIIVGQTLQLNGSPYVVVPGDTLTKLALRTTPIQTPPAAPEPPAAAPVPPPAPAPAPEISDAAYVAPPAPLPAPVPMAINWDAVARCESGNNWAINTGNGFSGGLQWAPGTWAAYKPAGAPAQAYNASRDQQIQAANALYARQGRAPWPICGRLG
jgi:resuscitation-promoting factor RpfE